MASSIFISSPEPRDPLQNGLPGRKQNFLWSDLPSCYKRSHFPCELALQHFQTTSHKKHSFLVQTQTSELLHHCVLSHHRLISPGPARGAATLSPSRSHWVAPEVALHTAQADLGSLFKGSRSSRHGERLTYPSRNFMISK